MRQFLFFIKHTIDFAKVDCILLKSAPRQYIFITLFALLIDIFLIFVAHKLQSSALFLVAMILPELIVWIFFVWFFQNLKHQNFFSHLLLNRSIYVVEIELLSFLLPFFAFLTIITLPFVAIIYYKIVLYLSLTYLTIIVDALLFSHLKIWQYLLLCVPFAIASSSITSNVDYASLFSNGSFSSIYPAILGDLLQFKDICFGILQIALQLIIIRFCAVKKIK